MGCGTSLRKRRGKFIVQCPPTVRVAVMRGRGRDGLTEISLAWITVHDIFMQLRYIYIVLYNIIPII